MTFNAKLFDELTVAEVYEILKTQDILDKFLCDISDLYSKLNTASSQVCCPEFAGSDMESIRKLRPVLIGRHAYNKQDGQYVKLCIE